MGNPSFPHHRLDRFTRSDPSPPGNIVETMFLPRMGEVPAFLHAARKTTRGSGHGVRCGERERLIPRHSIIYEVEVVF